MRRYLLRFFIKVCVLLDWVALGSFGLGSDANVDGARLLSRITLVMTSPSLSLCESPKVSSLRVVGSIALFSTTVVALATA